MIHLHVSGSGDGQTVLGSGGVHDCPVCGDAGDFKAVCRYRYLHLWWICSIVTRKEYLIECDRCGNTIAGDRFELRKEYPRDGIPFIRKWGWAVCALLVASILAVAIVNIVAEDERAALEKRLDAFTESPRPGYVYLVNMASIPDSPEKKLSGTGEWGALLLMKKDGDTLDFALSKTTWNDAKKLETLMRDDLSEVAFMTDRRVGFDKNYLKNMRHKGHLTYTREGSFNLPE